MKKMMSLISAVLVMFAFSSPITSIAKSAEFFTIGTGGPTGVYFQTGNAICKMLHKSAISAEHGRKKGTAKAYRCTAPSTGGSNYNILDKLKMVSFNLVLLSQTGSSMLITVQANGKESSLAI